MSIPIDLGGRHYGKLVVLGRSEKRDLHNVRSYWDCVCECGNTRVVHRANLTSGRTTSCGCVHREKAREQATTHGGTGTRLHRIWSGMFTRCNNANYPDYRHYGGRGISVCEAWSSFEVFRDWATSHGYNDSLTLDREDNNGGYSPDNCRWVDRKQQANNTRRTTKIEYEGKTRPLSEWADIVGIPYHALWKRLYVHKWSTEKAFTTPLHDNGYKKTKEDL